MDELLEQIIQDISSDVNKLWDFVHSCNVVPQKKSLSHLIDKLEEIIAIRKDKQYIGIDTVDGIIVSANEIDGIIEKQDIPEDLLRGYYRYENGKIILDEKLRQKIWG